MSGDKDEDDPIDDTTHWVGNLPKAGVDSDKCSTECDTGGPQQPDIQRKEPPVAEGR